MRILLNCYCSSATDIKLKLLVFRSLEKGILEDWVLREFCTPKYRILSNKNISKRRYSTNRQYLLVRIQNGTFAKALRNRLQLDLAAPALLHLGVLDGLLASDQDLATHVAIRKEMGAPYLVVGNNLRPTLHQSQQCHA
jgi:hypothetical protein